MTVVEKIDISIEHYLFFGWVIYISFCPGIFSFSLTDIWCATSVLFDCSEEEEEEAPKLASRSANKSSRSVHPAPGLCCICPYWSLLLGKWAPFEG